MSNPNRKTLSQRVALALLLLILSFNFIGAATSSDGSVSPAKELTQEVRLSTPGTKSNVNLLRDEDHNSKITFVGGGEVAIRSSEQVYGLYLVWDAPPPKWFLVIAGKQIEKGQDGYLHQYIELPEGEKQFNVQFFGNASLCDLRVFTKGTLPDDLQVWSPPLKDADMLLLPTHGDDEHIYFGGTMPAYSAAGMSIQVAYMVNHNGESTRPHELLNGLWSAGIRSYPIIPSFYDKYAASLDEAKQIYDEDKILAYQVELIRRFKPEVIIGHDTNGEYGHGAHILNSRTLQKAVLSAADPAQLPDSATQYGVWDTKKTYLHLWEENAIVMDWDIPLDAFEGKTALEMAKESYSYHVSQQSSFQVAEGGKYDCSKFGLFRSTVGADVLKNDFFENIKTFYPPKGATASSAPSSEAVSSEVSSIPASSEDPSSDNKSSELVLDSPAAPDANAGMYEMLRMGLLVVAIAIIAITVAIWCVLLQNRRMIAKSKRRISEDLDGRDNKLE